MDFNFNTMHPDYKAGAAKHFGNMRKATQYFDNHKRKHLQQNQPISNVARRGDMSDDWKRRNEMGRDAYNQRFNQGKYNQPVNQFKQEPYNGGLNIIQKF